jgi:uncharacterized membrane protein YeiH
MRYFLEHIGVAVAAVTGVLAARGKRVDLFGVVVLAWVTAVGGGTLRDCALGSLPVFWVRDSSFVITAVGTALGVFVIARRYQLPVSGLQVADAFALALFTMVGQGKALELGATPAIGVVMGVITGVAGGVVRDLLLGEIPLVFRPEIRLYATAAILGATVYQISGEWLSAPEIRLWVGLISTLLVRLAGIRWGLSLPVFQDSGPEKDCVVSGTLYLSRDPVRRQPTGRDNDFTK